MSKPERDKLDPQTRRTLDCKLVLPPAHEDALVARVKARVLQAVRAQPQPPSHTVHASEDGWHEVAPGVQRKFLWASGSEQSWMVRAAPGASFDPHVHLADEECLVLSGTLRIGSDIELHAGDFHVGRKGGAHGRATTDTGFLVYVRGALQAG